MSPPTGQHNDNTVLSMLSNSLESLLRGQQEQIENQRRGLALSETLIGRVGKLEGGQIEMNIKLENIHSDQQDMKDIPMRVLTLELGLKGFSQQEVREVTTRTLALELDLKNSKEMVTRQETWQREQEEKQERQAHFNVGVVVTLLVAIGGWIISWLVHH